PCALLRTRLRRRTVATSHPTLRGTRFHGGREPLPSRGDASRTRLNPMDLRLKRVYDDASPGDGFRVLVDRLWPRGVSKERAEVDLWAKDVAPSSDLRKQYHHEGMTWDALVAAYRTDLAGPGAEALAQLRSEVARHPITTLLYSVHDPEQNHAVLLREALEAGSDA